MGLGRRYREVTCALCALAGVLGVVWLGVPTWADGPVLDLLITARALAAPGTDAADREPVVVIAVDHLSLDEPELAPYPRAFLAPVWATVLDGVLAAGARAVGFDLIFAYSANRFAPDFDAPFLAALARHRERVVLGRSASTLPAPPFLAALGNDEAALGLVELGTDADGRHRRVQARHRTGDEGSVAGLVDALLRRAGGPAMPPAVVLAPRRHPERLAAYALIDVLRCARRAPEALAGAFAGKIVLVGTTFPDEDRKRAPGWFWAPPRSDGPLLHPCGLRRLAASQPDSPTIPGVFLHATAVDAVARNRVTSLAPAGAAAFLSGLMAALGAALGLWLAPWLTAAAVLLGAVLLVGAAAGALAVDLWVPVALPLGTLTTSPAVAYVVRYLVEERRRRRVEHAFSHYLSPAIVERLARDASALQLGGERREVTVMFADLSGFTALSAKVEPEVLTRLTNRYLGLIVGPVEATGGYVDKFIGDAVLAVWGAPVEDRWHAANAIRAALEAVARIRQECLAAEAGGEPGFSVKIGINSGPAVVGNVGTEKRYNYTAVGETVNVASRLESVPGYYACQVVVGPWTAELAREEFLLRELDWVRVKGRQEPLAIYEPLVEHARATPETLDRAARYAEALTHYRAMRFADACAVWDALAREEQAAVPGQDGQDDAPPNPASRMAERARAFMTDPPGASWDGVFNLTSK